MEERTDRRAVRGAGFRARFDDLEVGPADDLFTLFVSKDEGRGHGRILTKLSAFLEVVRELLANQGEIRGTPAVR